MKRALVPLLVLSALLTACVPASLRAQSAAPPVSAQLSDAGLKVDTGYYRRPGPSTLQVKVDSAEPTYLYALLLPEQQAAQLLVPALQPVQAAQDAAIRLPPVFGYTQVFVVASQRPLTFGPLGSSVSSLAGAVSAATAGLPSGSWTVATQVYRVSDYASLTVLSAPEDANVYINDSYTGRTPLTLSAVPVGKVNLRLERDGYQAARLSLNLAPNQSKTLKLGLLPQQFTGRLSVQSSVPAQVLLRGQDLEQRGSVPYSVTLPTGQYDLTVTPQDPALQAAWVGVNVDRNQSVSVACQPSGAQLDCRIQ